MKRLTGHQQLLVMSALEDRIDWCRTRLQGLTDEGACTSSDTNELLAEVRELEAIYDLLADAHTVTITSLAEVLSTSGLAGLAAVAGHDDARASTSGRRS